MTTFTAKLIGDRKWARKIEVSQLDWQAHCVHALAQDPCRATATGSREALAPSAQDANKISILQSLRSIPML